MREIDIDAAPRVRAAGLLADGIAVERVAPVTTSLQDLFLTMTIRLEDRA